MAELELSPKLQRARDYIGIFIKAGDRWRDFAPVDGHIIDDQLHLDGLRIWPKGDSWCVADADGHHWGWRAADPDEGDAR